MKNDLWEQFADDWGPEKIIHIYEPRLPLRAIVVIDNTALGPAIGGIRLAPDLNTAEIFRLARTMTWKNAAAGLPHGGAKAGILAEAGLPRPEKERLLRAVGRAIAELSDYIPGPDMGTDEACMAFI
ncbi:MAG: Glu/Leu/Phe/Val dehydrogenase dimerization domain-containing protein, partial [Desulfobacca sp.]|uniref:Glu/Leu/Phe/Val dehydrogenase dimerization domain-containing protein n=1 Tax=Desulfobacca sp. TaxID=2067990 RepID=UPI00404AD390